MNVWQEAFAIFQGRQLDIAGEVIHSFPAIYEIISSVYVMDSNVTIEFRLRLSGRLGTDVCLSMPFYNLHLRCSMMS